MNFVNKAKELFNFIFKKNKFQQEKIKKQIETLRKIHKEFKIKVGSISIDSWVTNPTISGLIVYKRHKYQFRAYYVLNEWSILSLEKFDEFDAETLDKINKIVKFICYIRRNSKNWLFC